MQWAVVPESPSAEIALPPVPGNFDSLFPILRRRFRWSRSVSRLAASLLCFKSWREMSSRSG